VVTACSWREARGERGGKEKNAVSFFLCGGGGDALDRVSSVGVSLQSVSKPDWDVSPCRGGIESDLASARMHTFFSMCICRAFSTGGLTPMLARGGPRCGMRGMIGGNHAPLPLGKTGRIGIGGGRAPACMSSAPEEEGGGGGLFGGLFGGFFGGGGANMEERDAFVRELTRKDGWDMKMTIGSEPARALGGTGSVSEKELTGWVEYRVECACVARGVVVALICRCFSISLSLSLSLSLTLSIYIPIYPSSLFLSLFICLSVYLSVTLRLWVWIGMNG
jgi:hypothetical protein